MLNRLAAMPLGEGAAPMLPRERFTSHEFFEYERETLFAASWICVGRAEKIPEPGDYLAATVAGEQLLIVRGKDREICATR